MDLREADEIELQEEQLYALQLLQELPDKHKTVHGGESHGPSQADSPSWDYHQ